MKAVQKVVDAEENVVLNSHITVADAMRAKMYLKNFGEFYRNQVEFASAVILSRSQNVKEDKLEKAVALLRDIHGHGRDDAHDILHHGHDDVHIQDKPVLPPSIL